MSDGDPTGADEAGSQRESTDANGPGESGRSAASAGTEPDGPDGSARSSEAGAGGRDVERYVRYALLAGLTLLALVALVRFYFAASNAIDTWVTDEYRPLFQAAFNLVVLLVAAVGISRQARRLA